MIEQLRQRLAALQKAAGIEDDPGCLPLGIAAIDEALGGGLSRGALHEIAAPGEAHLAAATGFALGLAAGARGRLCWIAEDMALAESGTPYGPGLDAFNLAPERLLTVAAAHRRDLLWTMEEALRCRAIGSVIGELRHGALDAVAVRRLSLAAANSGALALLLRCAPASDASTAATRWIAGAAPSSSFLPSPGWGGSANEVRRGGVTYQKRNSPPPDARTRVDLPPPGGGEKEKYEFGSARFAAHLVRNRRGPTGSWILEWSDTDERFVLATPALPLAAPALDRSHRKVASAA
jgi:protein ImuA